MEKVISINDNAKEVMEKLKKDKFRNSTINSIKKEVDTTADKILKNENWSLIKNILKLIHKEYFLLHTKNGIALDEKCKLECQYVDRKLLQENMLMMRNDFYKVESITLYGGGEESKTILLKSRDSKSHNYHNILYPDTMGRIVQHIGIMDFWQEVNQHTEIAVLIEILSRLDSILVNEKKDSSKVTIQEFSINQKGNWNLTTLYDKTNNKIYFPKRNGDKWDTLFEEKIYSFFDNYKSGNYFFPNNLDDYLKGYKETCLEFLYNEDNELVCTYKINSDIWKALAKPDILTLFEKYTFGNNKNKKRKTLNLIYDIYCSHEEWNDVHLDYEMERILCLNLIMKIYEYVDGVTKDVPEFMNGTIVDIKKGGYPTYPDELVQKLCNNICKLTNPYIRLRFIDCLYQDRFFKYNNKLNENYYSIADINYIENEFQTDCSVIWQSIAKILSNNKIEHIKKSINNYLQKNYSQYLHISRNDVQKDILSKEWKKYREYKDNNKNTHLKTMENIILKVYENNQENLSRLL